MKKFLFSFFILLLAKNAISSVTKNPVDLIGEYMKLTEKIGQLKGHLIEIKNQIRERELDLSDDELKDEIDSLIEENPLVQAVQDKLTIDSKCEDVFNTTCDELYDGINENITLIVEDNLFLIDADYDKLKKDVKRIEETIEKELKLPQTHSIICEASFENCPLVTKLVSQIDVNFKSSNMLKEKLLNLNNEALSYFKDNHDLLSYHINELIIKPYDACLDKIQVQYV